MRALAIAALGLTVVCCKGSEQRKTQAAPEPAAAAVEPARDAGPGIDAAPRRPPVAYFKALRKGRKQARSRDYAGAVAAFEEALGLWPDDPVVLSELSWVAFLTGEHDRAIELGTRSVDKARRPSIKAASLYNLGRAFEAKGVNESAIISYQNSLLLRPNQIVTDRLSALLGKKVAGGYAPVVLAGPTTLPDVCKQVAIDDCETAKVSKELAQVMAPYKQVAGLDVPADGGQTCVLGLHLEPGWFVATRYLDCREDNGEQSIDSIQLIAQDEGAPLVRFDYTASLSSRVAQYDDSYSVICGVGASKVPSCTPAIHRRNYSWDLYLETDDAEGWDKAEVTKEEWSKEVSVSPEGVLSIKDEKGKVETHPLVFP
jgi:tetratricopeptide (TPR) repeat protein